MPIELFLKNAYLILLLWTLTEQIGVPIPTVPLLLTAGTLTATHRLLLLPVLSAVVLGCVISDIAWYFLGKRFGGTVVRLLCRLSPEQSNCVRRTNSYFGKHGAAALLVAKFIPAFSTMAGAIAGQTRMDFRLFLACDLAGSLLWAGSFTLAGRFFGDYLKHHPNALAWFANSAGAVFILLVVGFILYRIYKRRLIIAQLRTARLSPGELHGMLEEGQDVFIVDLRHPLDYLPDPRTLPGAVMMTPDRLVEDNAIIPRDRDVVLFCTCPSEATSVKMALTIRRLGVERVRPLQGGLDEWKRLGFPLVPIPGVEEQPMRLESAEAFQN